MTCYRVNWRLTEDELNPVMDWLDKNREQTGLIRNRADLGRDARTGDAVWYTKFVFRTEEGVRMFLRQWDKNYSEDWVIPQWR